MAERGWGWWDKSASDTSAADMQAGRQAGLVFLRHTAMPGCIIFPWAGCLFGQLFLACGDAHRVSDQGSPSPRFVNAYSLYFDFLVFKKRNLEPLVNMFLSFFALVS